MWDIFGFPQLSWSRLYCLRGLGRVGGGEEEANYHTAGGDAEHQVLPFVS